MKECSSSANLRCAFAPHLRRQYCNLYLAIRKANFTFSKAALSLSGENAVQQILGRQKTSSVKPFEIVGKVENLGELDKHILIFQRTKREEPVERDRHLGMG